MKKNYLLPFFLLALPFLNACNKDSEAPINIAVLNGYVQKGPFIIGTNITVSELNHNLSQTGKTFSASIRNDEGAFSLQDLKLSSGYVELSANGYYFNEVSGKLSDAQLTFSAISDLSSSASINVNLLTHLEKSRVEHLLSGDRLSFDEAKKKAQQELLSLFNISKSDVISSEKLNIAEAGEDNAILLAISAILQSKRTESELTELLSKISLDIESDGTLDNAALQSELINEAVLLDQKAVRENVARRYNQLGMNVTAGDFEKHVNHFIRSTAFAFNKKIEYPLTGTYGKNILADTASIIVLPRGNNYDWYGTPIFRNTFTSLLTPQAEPICG